MNNPIGVNLDDAFPLSLGLNFQLMTVTVEILDKHALNLLKELEQMQVIRLLQQTVKSTTSNIKKKEFKATRLDTTGFKFDRDEANER